MLHEGLDELDYAREMRKLHRLTSEEQAGQSDAQILATIERAYGPSVLLSPSISGLGLVLWAGPVVVVLGAMVIGARLRKRS